MTAKQKRLIVLANLIGSILRTYQKKETTRALEELRLRLRKGMTKQFKKYGKEALDAIDVGDDIWTAAIEEFKLTSIEASTFVLEMSFIDEKGLSKHFGLGKGKLAEWAKVNRKIENPEEMEANSRKVAKFIKAELNKIFGIEEKELSFKERLALHRAKHENV